MARAGHHLADPRIPTTTLVASGSFGARLSPSQVAGAIARGLQAGGRPAYDLCPIESSEEPPSDIRAVLDAVDFDARMRRARAVVLAERCLAERTLQESATFEIATRARQAGVPAYAITSENRLDSFDARILDLQVILLADSARALTAEARKLAMLI